MKLRLGMLGLLLIGIIGCGKSVPKTEDWFTFHSPNGNYSVLMPSKPKKQTQASAGESIDVYISEVGRYFAVVTTAFNLPEAPDLQDKDLIKEAIDTTVEETLKAMNGKLIEQKEITIGGKFPGREFSGTFDAPGVGKSVVRGRIVLTDSVLMSLNIAGTDDYIKLPQVQQCLDSLKFK
jgi:hypothetical protein